MVSDEQRLNDILGQLRRAALIDCKPAVIMLTHAAIILHNRIQRSKRRRAEDVQIMGWSVV